MTYDYIEINNLVKKCVLNTKRYYPTDKLIGKYMGVLRNVFKYDKDDIHDLIQDITIYVLTPGERGGQVPMSRYDPEKAGLYTFVNMQVYGYVCRLVRNLFNKRKLNVIEILESDIGEPDFNIFEHLPDEKTSSEDELIMKEDIEYMEKEFGEDFVDIILKHKSQTDIAEEQDMTRAGISYRYNRDLEILRERENK